MRRPTRRLAPAAIAAVLLVTAAACGGDDGTPSEDALEELIESQGGGDVELDAEDGEVSIESDEGSLTAGTEIPEDWPDDVPLPEDFTVEGASEITDNASGSTMMTATGTTGMSMEEIEEFYTSAMGDWEETLNMSSSSGGEESLQLGYESDGRVVYVGVTSEEGGNTVAITYNAEGS